MCGLCWIITSASLVLRPARLVRSVAIFDEHAILFSLKATSSHSKSTKRTTSAGTSYICLRIQFFLRMPPGTVPYSYDFLSLLRGKSWSVGRRRYRIGKRSAVRLVLKLSQMILWVGLWTVSRPQRATKGWGSTKTSEGTLKRGSNRSPEVEEKEDDGDAATAFSILQYALSARKTRIQRLHSQPQATLGYLGRTDRTTGMITVPYERQTTLEG